MKYSIPEISWHNRDPVLSVDFQPTTSDDEHCRLATGGTDTHVLIWYISMSEAGVVNLEIAADLTRHQKAVNVVRWSPSGEYLASGDDESIIFVWKKSDKEPAPAAEGEEQQKESWIIYKTLRGHVEDVLDISWSPCSGRLVSGSVDNKMLVWELSKNHHVLGDHKGFVQGVAWDPSGHYLVSACSDRVFRTFDVNTKKVVARSSKSVLPFPKDHPLHNIKVRLYHDDTLQTYYRRLSFSPDGMLIAVPAGKIEPEQGKTEQKPINALYIYTRYSLKVPMCVIPCGESPAVVCRWSPVQYRVRSPRPCVPLRSRMVLAVLTRRALLLYDTQQVAPLALLSHIHYTRLTDMSWSSDGDMLVVSSTDGFCSIIRFSPGELGEPLPKTLPETKVKETPVTKTTTSQETKLHDLPKEEKDKPKTFVFNSPFRARQSLEKVKSPMGLDEEALPAWTDNSQTGVREDSDSQDLKLYYDDTQGAGNTDVEMKESKPESPKLEGFLKNAKVVDVKEPVVPPVPAPSRPAAPRRVNFITLSSPKANKKKL